MRYVPPAPGSVERDEPPDELLAEIASAVALRAAELLGIDLPGGRTLARAVVADVVAWSRRCMRGVDTEVAARFQRDRRLCAGAAILAAGTGGAVPAPFGFTDPSPPNPVDQADR